jgi:hypothetical protein
MIFFEFYAMSIQCLSLIIMHCLQCTRSMSEIASGNQFLATCARWLKMLNAVRTKLFMYKVKIRTIINAKIRAAVRLQIWACVIIPLWSDA